MIFSRAIERALGATKSLFVTDVPGTLDKIGNLIKKIVHWRGKNANWRRRHFQTVWFQKFYLYRDPGKKTLKEL